VTEFELIEKYFRPLAIGNKASRGLLDDAATLGLAAGYELVVAKDIMAAGVHFLNQTPARYVARKLLRVNLSDLAAMGARPIGYLLGLSLAKPLDVSWVAEFAKGLGEDQVRFGLSLMGGDTISTDGPTQASITIMGEVKKGCAISRAGARPGDSIFVSGTLGDGALGLKCLRGELEAADYLISRFNLPSPRLELGAGLVGMANAMVDISDGLISDLGHVLAASGCGARLNRDDLPLSPDAARLVAGNRALWPLIWAGGDDYELVFTAPPQFTGKISDLAEKLNIKVSRIGQVVGRTGLSLVDKDGNNIDPVKTGYTHFE
jgi:thiamine-monophosphate kinase